MIKTGINQFVTCEEIWGVRVQCYCWRCAAESWWYGTITYISWFHVSRIKRGPKDYILTKTAFIHNTHIRTHTSHMPPTHGGGTRDWTTFTFATSLHSLNAEWRRPIGRFNFDLPRDWLEISYVRIIYGSDVKLCAAQPVKPYCLGILRLCLF